MSRNREEGKFAGCAHGYHFRTRSSKFPLATTRHAKVMMHKRLLQAKISNTARE